MEAALRRGSRAEALLALLTEGCEDLATAQVVPAPKRPQGKGTGGPGGSVRPRAFGCPRRVRARTTSSHVCVSTP